MDFVQLVVKDALQYQQVKTQTQILELKQCQNAHVNLVLSTFATQLQATMTKILKVTTKQNHR